MMSACCGTEIASIRAAVGEEIVGRQLECGQTAFQLYIYDDVDCVIQHKYIDKIHSYV